MKCRCGRVAHGFVIQTHRHGLVSVEVFGRPDRREMRQLKLRQPIRVHICRRCDPEIQRHQQRERKAMETRFLTPAARKLGPRDAVKVHHGCQCLVETKYPTQRISAYCTGCGNTLRNIAFHNRPPTRGTRRRVLLLEMRPGDVRKWKCLPILVRLQDEVRRQG